MQRFGGHVEPRRNGAADEIAARIERVECGCRAEINQQQWRAKHFFRGDERRQTVRAQCARVVVFDMDAAFDSRCGKERFHAQIFYAQLAHRFIERGHHRDDGCRVNGRGREVFFFKKCEHERGVFVCRFVCARFRAPRVFQRLALENSETYIGVADFDGEQARGVHGSRMSA